MAKMNLNKLLVISENKINQNQKKSDLRKLILTCQVLGKVSDEMRKENIDHKINIKNKKVKSVSASRLQEKLDEANDIKTFLEEYVQGGIELKAMHEIVASYSEDYVDEIIFKRHRNFFPTKSNLVLAEMREKEAMNGEKGAKNKRKNKNKNKKTKKLNNSN